MFLQPNMSWIIMEEITVSQPQSHIFEKLLIVLSELFPTLVHIYLILSINIYIYDIDIYLFYK